MWPEKLDKAALNSGFADTLTFCWRDNHQAGPSRTHRSVWKAAITAAKLSSVLTRQQTIGKRVSTFMGGVAVMEFATTSLEQFDLFNSQQRKSLLQAGLPQVELKS